MKKLKCRAMMESILLSHLFKSNSVRDLRRRLKQLKSRISFRMACGGVNNWDLLCPVCKTFIEKDCFNDIQASLDLHYLNIHPTLKALFILKKQKIVFNEDKVYGELKECTNYIICPVCENLVEIFQNNINHCFMEHFEICHQQIHELDSANNLSVKKQTEHFTEVKNRDRDSISNLKTLTLTDQPYKSFDLSQDLENHRGYITVNSSSFVCHVCGETLNTEQMVEYHLKTKRHEDNVIIWLKGKLSNHMQSTMEYVSFYGSNLCCNLCRCKIEMNSQNPQETLLNVISHNNDVKHSQAKSLKNPKDNNSSLGILELITEKNSLINQHKEFIEAEIEPRFSCKLCEKIIHFNKNNFELEQNFLTHINSKLHSENSKAIRVLRLFKDMNGDRNGVHCFSVLNGSINCTQCNSLVPANIEQLLEHCKSYEKLKSDKFLKSPLSTNKLPSTKNNKFPLNNSSDTGLANLMSSDETPLKPHHSSPMAQPKENMTKGTSKLNIKEILLPLKNQYGNITCMAENENGKLVCVICNCSVQPSTRFVKIHLSGKFHKNKTQCQIKQLSALNTGEEACRDLKLNSDGARESYHLLVEHLFQSLPQRFQDDKDFCTINLTDGSVHCVLCNCTIDPMFLKDHLQEEGHLAQKQLQSL
ncbi:uncharacterized protein LOC128988037 isoform X4 [Macrosteles quadrilineatus]|uniref:uncharacterized protein LOC128988037 isoform X4 n=2 Tax=Macrosteles quadrilineatus TaxID=74068 RepID=UPI0023E13DD6|nr:uncharacterized protein LOC128988037 isoform X4 [Macrosteles quadrilineatus]